LPGAGRVVRTAPEEGRTGDLLKMKKGGGTLRIQSCIISRDGMACWGRVLRPFKGASELKGEPGRFDGKERNVGNKTNYVEGRI